MDIIKYSQMMIIIFPFHIIIYNNGDYKELEEKVKKYIKHKK